MSNSQPSGAQVYRLPSTRRRWWIRQWPLTLVLIGVGVSLVLIGTNHFRRGSVLLAACVVLAFFLRLMLPSLEAGLLAMRSRKADLLVLAALGLGLGIFSLWVPAPN